MRSLHGLTEHPLYNVWCLIKQRCLNPRNPRYARYGGRGITICEEWMVFQSFHQWAITHGWRPGLTIERQNNDGNYCPANCCFILRGQQQWNNHQTKLKPAQIPAIRHRLTNGDTMKAIAKDYNVSRTAIWMIARDRQWRGISK